MNLDQALQTFIEESLELLAAMEDALLTLEANPGDTDAINAVFRAMHTIKGSAGLFGLTHIVAFTHVAESLLDRVRNGELQVDESLMVLMLGSRDHIGNLIDRLAAGDTEPDADMQGTGDTLVAGMNARLGIKPQSVAKYQAKLPIEREVTLAHEGGGPVESDTWHISVRFARDLFRNGFDPLSFVRYLGTLGQLVHVETITCSLPAAEKMDPESCYLGFEISLAAQVDKSVIEAAFDFVREDCSLAILAPHSQIGEYVRLIESLPEDSSRLGEILVACGALTDKELAEALVVQELKITSEQIESEAAQTTAQPKPLGEILVTQKLVQPEVVGAALEKQLHVRDTKAHESRVIRVDATKLDQLINLVGELVIAGAGASLLAGRSGDSALQESTALISRVVEEIRDTALRLRMVQIGETLNRFQRVVRDVSKELDKDIELVITGGETELDKAVVEKIGDPLTHLVRNAMDHGVEPRDVRAASGKPAKARLALNAYHDSGSIVIEVAEDGAGLNRDRILAKAIERGLVSATASLSDREIYQLIFEPGFSTADQVSNLSGRGVGMDVVRRNIEALRGTVELDSQPGQGTTVRIRLPLTLAIIDGFLVGVGDSACVVPLEMVLECVALADEDRDALAHRGYINLRGAALPLLRLREHFEFTGASPRRENIVVVHYAGHKAGLVVDELMGEFQTVIKPLGKLFSRIKGFAGSTILGTGEVALILDVPSLVQQAAATEAGLSGMTERAATLVH